MFMFFGGGDLLGKWSIFLKSELYRTVFRDLLFSATFCWGDLSKNDEIGPKDETVGGNFSGEMFTFFSQNDHFAHGSPLFCRTFFCLAVEIDQNSKELGKKIEFSRPNFSGENFPKRHFFLRF